MGFLNESRLINSFCKDHIIEICKELEEEDNPEIQGGNGASVKYSYRYKMVDRELNKGIETVGVQELLLDIFEQNEQVC